LTTRASIADGQRSISYAERACINAMPPGAWHPAHRAA